MLTEICAKLHNYFLVPDGIHKGEFKIEGGKITPLDFLQEGQYFRIVGSVFNDGVHRYVEADLDLTDEAFSGAIWALAIPPKLVDLSREIKAFCESEAGKPGAFVSESFGGYSYSRGTDANGAALDWPTVFRARLNEWRKLQ
nr:MAG TPA: Protein of unknown function (DUF3199) [Caudoviricetes sp.]